MSTDAVRSAQRVVETLTAFGIRYIFGVPGAEIIMRDNAYNMVEFQEELKYGRTSGVRLGDYNVIHHAAGFGARGIRVGSLADFELAVTTSLTEPGVTIIDVLVDYSRNAELFAELHDDVLE